MKLPGITSQGGQFWLNNAVFFVGTMSVAFTNYLFYPVLGRMLSLPDFGEVQLLFSVYVQMVLVVGALQIVVVNITANAKRGSVQPAIYQLFRSAMVVMLLAAVIMVAASPAARNFFHLHSALPVMLIAASMVVTVPLTFQLAFLQGKKCFGYLSLASFLGAVLKLVVAAVLVLAGWRVFGAVTGLTIGQLMALAFTTWAVRSRGWRWSEAIGWPRVRQVRREVLYALVVLSGMLAATFLFSADILAVKRFFPADVAGQYAGIAAIARIIIYACASVPMVMLASAGPGFSAEHNLAVLVRSVGLVFVIGGTVLAAFWAAPGTVITLMVGARYTPLAHLLPLLGTVLLLAALVNVGLIYMVAQRRSEVVPVGLLGVAIVVIMLGLFHASLGQIAADMGCGSAGVVLLLFGIALYHWVKGWRTRREPEIDQYHRPGVQRGI